MKHKHRYWNETEKRDATPDELKYLRVNAEGCVEHGCVVICYGDRYFYKTTLSGFKISGGIEWQPAPEWTVIWNDELYETKITELEKQSTLRDKALKLVINDMLSYEYQQFGSPVQDEELYVIRNSREYISKYLTKAEEE